MSPAFWDIAAAPSFLLTLGVLIAIVITQAPFVRAILREQRRARMLRAAGKGLDAVRN